LDDAKDRLKRQQDALFLLEIGKADKKLALGLHHDCKEILDEMRVQMERLSDVDPKVFSSLAQVYSLYYRRQEDHENFYKSCMQFLAYTPIQELSEQQKKDFSIKMGMAILLGKKVFNIAELLDKEIINVLIGTDFEWLYHLMSSLGKGQIA
jgi:26S proteasome regulatory subunit N9